MGGAQGSKVGGGDAVGALGFLTYKPSHPCCPGLDWGPWGVWVGGVEEQSAPSVACGERCPGLGESGVCVCVAQAGLHVLGMPCV